MSLNRDQRCRDISHFSFLGVVSLEALSLGLELVTVANFGHLGIGNFNLETLPVAPDELDLHSEMPGLLLQVLVLHLLELLERFHHRVVLLVQAFALGQNGALFFGQLVIESFLKKANVNS